MRLLLVLALVAVACASTIQLRPMSSQIDKFVSDKLVNDIFDEDAEIEVITGENEDGTVEIAPAYIVSWQMRRFIRKLQKEMPCGFPEYGIPPLAPLKVREANVHFEKGMLESSDEIYRFLLNGLDDFKIKKFKLNMITSKITFDFLFKDIAATAPRYVTDTILDAMRQMGLSVEYEGDGSLDFGLKGLRIKGVLKFKLPVLWGSARIIYLKTTVSVNSCQSAITGLLGDGSLNRMLNRQIENFVQNGINNNQELISDKIEETLVPPVNKMLKGNDFWTLVDYILSSSEGESEDDPIVTKCVPPANPWA